ncbi:MAG TPA: aminotransferase class I/II-fold pyridoxal phosphate-dependent enzyme [bacterium]|nr:aminotransferase class I/II-fold pyridoxal phosphate-dependent enzyme [bacterium]
MREPSAARLGLIPPYLFQELDDLKSRAGHDLIDLGEGSPDQPAPRPISAALTRALKNTENHRYPSYLGKLAARAAVASWYRRRFHVELDPETEVSMLLGSKEGVAHLIWGTCGPGDTVAISDPGYPVYLNQSRLAGATPIPVPLEEKNHFLVDLDWLSRIAPRIKLLCLNFPSNPTAAVATIEFYREVVALAQRHGFFVVNDNVYSELYFGRSRPPSILEVPGARDRCVEFHSLSKTFNMAGWRIGMAVGNSRLIKSLLKIKQNTDSGPFGAIQDAAVCALQSGAKFAAANRAMYKRRRDAFCGELVRHGWDVNVPEATFYIWARVPPGHDTAPAGESASLIFTRQMLSNCRVMCAPGTGFGQYGEGFVRFALIAPEKQLKEAGHRIGKWLNNE